MRIKTAAVLVAGALALFGAGCGGDDAADDPDAPTTAPTPDPADSPDGDADGADDADDSGQAPTAFNEETASGSYECGGQDVTVNSETADLEFTGACGIVVINGDDAEVIIEEAEMIVVNGENASVVYGGDPEVVVNGENASAEAADAD
ncbi:DUF3060 domain-containing protein [Natronosporangium hydrolyticum]|uniref:DUF3060 domain-containing protein n=1 Tax=Natronosporangium hydrolyticum TaxID=2811111 RepID=A0A895YMY9_9ACTN|nr:DUF3060 domain-containing protein [Natronosporangium hydrolyticum]QSB15288.1 DUF3060 domain-containing protein [Natronosporangium hydrolyticum]